MTEATATPEPLQGFFDGLGAALGTAQEAGKRAAEQHLALLSPFFAGLAPTIEAQRRLDRLVATGFSVFHYFNENENLVSGIFADLLRPHGSHGQGATFLRLFLQEIDRGNKPCIRKRADYGELEKCSVFTEYSTTKGRRIDIALKLDDMWIGVENKPWAVEQKDQLQHYLEFLRQRDGQACVLYLSGDGEDAKTIKDRDRAHYLKMPYGRMKNGPSVAHWIAECHRRCEAENVRWFLKDLLKYIARMFYADDLEESL